MTSARALGLAGLLMVACSAQGPSIVGPSSPGDTPVPSVVPAISRKGVLVKVDAVTGVEEWRMPLGHVADPPTTAGDLLIVSEIDLDNSTGALRALRMFDGGEAWTLELGTGLVDVREALALGDSVVFTTANDHGGSTMARVGADGTVLWRIEEDDLLSNVPAVDRELLFTEVANAAVVMAVNADDGTVRWRVTLDQVTAARPMMVGDTLIVVTHQSLYGLNPKSGEILYRVAVGLDAVNEAGRGGDGTVLLWGFGSGGLQDGLLRAFNAESGASLWKRSALAFTIYDLPDAGPQDPTLILESPALEVPGSLLVLDPRSGRIRWSENSVAGPPSLHDETVFMATRGGLTAFDTQSGRRRWTNPGVRSGFVPPSLGDTVLYAFDGTPNETVSIAVDAASGKELWRRRETAAYQFGTVTTGAVFIAITD